MRGNCFIYQEEKSLHMRCVVKRIIAANTWTLSVLLVLVVPGCCYKGGHWSFVHGLASACNISIRYQIWCHNQPPPCAAAASWVLKTHFRWGFNYSNCNQISAGDFSQILLTLSIWSVKCWVVSVSLLKLVESRAVTRCVTNSQHSRNLWFDSEIDGPPPPLLV